MAVTVNTAAKTYGTFGHDDMGTTDFTTTSTSNVDVTGASLASMPNLYFAAGRIRHSNSSSFGNASYVLGVVDYAGNASASNTIQDDDHGHIVQNVSGGAVTIKYQASSGNVAWTETVHADNSGLVGQNLVACWRVLRHRPPPPGRGGGGNL